MDEYGIGARIGDAYQVLDVLKGGMGIVYVVSNLRENVKRALKTYRAEYTWSPDLLERFLREAKIWIDITRLSDMPAADPFVVRAYGVQIISGRPYIELEYIEGGSVANLKYVTFPLVVDLSIQFCKGMQFLNKILPGFVHCDVKPENLLIKRLIGDLLVLKITDFGLANIKDELSKTQAIVNVGMGDRIYMSPEQALGSKTLDFRSDIYSFGLVMYEMLTIGREHGTSRWYQIMLQLTKELRDGNCSLKPSSLNQEIPASLENIVMKCLHKDPGKRYQDFNDLQADLDAVVEEQHFDATQHDFVATGKHMTLDMDYFHDKRDPVEERMWSAISYANVGEYEMAIRCFDEAIELEPENAVVLANKGHFLLQHLGKPYEALLVLERSLSINPDNEYTWTYKGMAHQDIGQLKEAEHCYDRAIDINRNFCEAWRNKGALLSNLGKLQEALHYFRKAEEIKSDDALLHKCKGITYEKLRQFEEAAASYRRAFELNPRDMESLVCCGNCLVRQRRFEEGAAQLYRALEVDANYALAWLILGGCNYNQGKLREALHCFERTKELDPDLAEQHNVDQLMFSCLAGIWQDRKTGKG